jgi:DNA polymerase-3 subunit epsilon
MKPDKIIPYLVKRKYYNSPISGQYRGLVVDAEATKPDSKTGKIIQLTLLPFDFSDDLKIHCVYPAITMFNDPGEPITAEITKLTGITDEMVKGKSLDHDLIKEQFIGLEICIAHNAEFDRQIIETHVQISDVIWGCSQQDIDWKAKFINSRALAYLAFCCGFWYEGHDSEEDCYALLEILAHEYEGKIILY